ncbi:MAG: TlpA family protein disulfide reductase [Acidobacteriota bacterium]
MGRNFSTALLSWAAVAFFLAASGCGYFQGPGPKVVIGMMTVEQWKQERGWNAFAYDTYSPSETETGKLSRLAQEKEAAFLIFGGSWCPDTVSQMPEILKILDHARIPHEKVAIYGLDRQLREESGTAQNYGIERVPTLVVTSKDQEIGRIIEFPDASWEEDLAKILSR